MILVSNPGCFDFTLKDLEFRPSDLGLSVSHLDWVILTGRSGLDMKLSDLEF